MNDNAFYDVLFAFALGVVLSSLVWLVVFSS